MTKVQPSTESTAYSLVGASSSKAGVLAAVGGASKKYFAEPVKDIAGDPNYVSFIHADGAGTKSIVNYLQYCESKNAKAFKGLAYDSMVMNVDDLACVGAFEGLLLSNTIGRNKNLIPDEAIGELVAGYRECRNKLEEMGITVDLGGGETADVGDVVRTLIVDSTLFARAKQSSLIDCSRMKAGDVIIGLSSTGQAKFEERPNSGIGSNGLSLARHTLIKHEYAERFPEILDPKINKEVAYRGPYALSDKPTGLGMTIGEAISSPTRTYAPIVKKVLGAIGTELHGAIHCTGGGQCKILKFGSDLKYIKDNLFDVPPIFKLIQEAGKVSWDEMYKVINMGHRMELILPKNHADFVIKTAQEFGIAAQQIGYVASGGDKNSLTISSTLGTFEFHEQ